MTINNIVKIFKNINDTNPKKIMEIQNYLDEKEKHFFERIILKIQYENGILENTKTPKGEEIFNYKIYYMSDIDLLPGVSVFSANNLLSRVLERSDFLKRNKDQFYIEFKTNKQLDLTKYDENSLNIGYLKIMDRILAGETEITHVINLFEESYKEIILKLKMESSVKEERVKIKRNKV